MRREIKWKLIRRLSKYPEELENDSGFMRTLSPSFLQYIDINKSLNQFVIKDTFSMRELLIVPKHFMDPSKEPIKEIMNRFEWINDDAIKLINRDGIEKIFEINDDFAEREYNMIPVFDYTEIQDPIRHFYSNRRPLCVS